MRLPVSPPRRSSVCYATARWRRESQPAGRRRSANGGERRTPRLSFRRFASPALSVGIDIFASSVRFQERISKNYPRLWQRRPSGLPYGTPAALKGCATVIVKTRLVPRERWTIDVLVAGEDGPRQTSQRDRKAHGPKRTSATTKSMTSSGSPKPCGRGRITTSLDGRESSRSIAHDESRVPDHTPRDDLPRVRLRTAAEAAATSR